MEEDSRCDNIMLPPRLPLDPGLEQNIAILIMPPKAEAGV
jgi:hypothetical protein